MAPSGSCGQQSPASGLWLASSALKLSGSSVSRRGRLNSLSPSFVTSFLGTSARSGMSTCSRKGPIFGQSFLLCNLM